MLIISIGPAAARPEILSQPPGTDPCVGVVLPGARLSRQALDGLLERCHVVEFLTPPDGTLAILDAVCQRLGHLLETLDGPLIFVNRPVSRAELAAILASAASGGEPIAATLGPDGALTELVIGAEAAANPLLPRFIQMLHARRVDDRLCVTLLRETFGNLVP